MYLYVAITKKKVFILRGKMPSPASIPDMHICHLVQRPTKCLAKRVSDCILLLLCLINMTKYIEKIYRFACGLFHYVLCLILCTRGCIWLYMLLICRWDGFSLLWFRLLRFLSGYVGCNMWPPWANIRLSESLLLVKFVFVICIVYSCEQVTWP